MSLKEKPCAGVGFNAIMDIKKITKEGEGVERVEGEEVMVGVGEEVVSTPPVESATKGGARSKRMRTSSESSPVKLDELSEARAGVAVAVEEMRAYLASNFSQKHTAFFERRFEKVFAEFKRVEGEYKKLSGLGVKVMDMDRTLRRMVECDWGKDLAQEVKKEVQESGDYLAAEMIRRNQESLDRIRTSVELALDTITPHDGERAKEIQSIREEVKEGMSKVAKEVRVSKNECGLVARCIDEVRSNMDRIHDRVVGVHEVVEPLETNVLREVNRRLDVMDVERIGEQVTSVMGEVAAKMEVGRAPERMEVDEVEEGTWAEVARRPRRGKRVIVEVPKGSDVKVEREKLVECLDVMKGEVRVRGIYRKGKDLVVEVHGKEDVERLQGNARLKEKGLVVDGEQGWRVRIFGVGMEIAKGELLEAMRVRNVELFQGISEEEQVRSFIPEFVVRRGGDVCDWVVRMAPRLFRRVMAWGRIYIGLRACRVIEGRGGVGGVIDMAIWGHGVMPRWFVDGVARKDIMKWHVGKEQSLARGSV